MPRAKNDTPETDATSKPRVSVRERRFANPFGESTPKIAFKRADITGRWFNEEIRNGQQVFRAKKDLGWEPVTPDMVADLDTLGAHEVDAAGHIVTGPRGHEHLMWMPTADYERIQRAKTAENNRRMKNPHAQHQEALEAYGGTNALGAEYASEQFKVTGATRTTKERIQRTGELE